MWGEGRGGGQAVSMTTDTFLCVGHNSYGVSGAIDHVVAVKIGNHVIFDAEVNPPLTSVKL